MALKISWFFFSYDENFWRWQSVCYNATDSAEIQAASDVTAWISLSIMWLPGSPKTAARVLAISSKSQGEKGEGP